MKRGGNLNRRTRLTAKPPINPNSPKRTKAPKVEPDWRKAMRQERESRRAARDAEVYALQWGAEYTTEYLSGWRDTCPLCGIWRPPFHRHHLTRRRTGGTAEDIVLLCWKCHDEIHGTRAASAPPMEEQARLRTVADHLAAAGRDLGYLPAERCDTCKRWHSRKYMVDVIEPGKETKRGCIKTCVLDRLP